ncbi:MAG: response regulator transcription factor [Prolixibacteraceae bacterium]
MSNITKQVKISIAAHHCLIISGIQACIGMCSIEANYLEFQNLDHLLKTQNKNNHYLIVHHSLLNVPKLDHLNRLIFNFRGKIMVLGSEKMNADFHQFLILPNDTEIEVIRKLNEFFANEATTIMHQQNDQLSAREIDVLKEVALGYSNKEIGDHLFISVNTVITHRKNITEKLGIKTIAGLTVYALMNSLINPGDVNV